MIKFSHGSLGYILRRFFKRLNAPYKIMVINSETMQEALSVDLTKKSLYLLFSTLLVSLFLLYSLLIFYTPLKLYVPGATNDVSRAKLKELIKVTDSLKRMNRMHQLHIQNISMICNGNTSLFLDTQALSKDAIEAALRQNDRQIDKASRYDYLKSEAKRKMDSIKSHNVDKDTSTEKLSTK